MAESTASVAVPPRASFWEDLIDIFYQPAEVFRRRVHASAWPPYLFVVVAIAIVTFATFPALQPAFDGEFSRNLPKIMAQNPQLTQEMVDKMQSYQAVGIRYAAGVATAGALLIVGFLVWLLGKAFGAVEGFAAAMLITSYAYMPRVLGAVITGAEALLMDPTKMNSLASVSFGPARLFDPSTTSPMLMAVLLRLDVTVLWETVLLAVGIAVIGRVPRGKAAVFGALIWIVGGLYQFRAAYLLS